MLPPAPSVPWNAEQRWMIDSWFWEFPNRRGALYRLPVNAEMMNIEWQAMNRLQQDVWRGFAEFLVDTVQGKADPSSFWELVADEVSEILVPFLDVAEAKQDPNFQEFVELNKKAAEEAFAKKHQADVAAPSEGVPAIVKKKAGIVVVVGGVVAVAAAAGGGWWWFFGRKKKRG